MPAKTRSLRIERVLTAIAGAGVILAALLVSRLGPAGIPVSLTAILLAFGCMLIGIGLLISSPRIGQVFARVSLVLLSLLGTLALGEVAFRAIGFDFNRVNHTIPIFNRPASFHDGGGILRRAGPASWRGKPLSAFVKYQFGLTNAYPHEKEIEIRYDKLGFRNPPELNDWEVAVTGDSFVESGYLPYEALFTTVAAKRLGVRVKNLGVTGTGPVFQTAYVRKYGKAPSTAHAVLCFYDGNDVTDLVREVNETNHIARTGYRRGYRTQSSMLAATSDRFRQWRQPITSKEQVVLKPDAVFASADGEIPAAVWPVAPPRWDDLKKSRQELLAAALANWSGTVRARGMQPWVMCIPDHRRVFHGYFRYITTNHPMAHWQSAQFGPYLGSLCANLDIRFIDTFPALRREVEAGRAPYNLLGDVHLNAHGSRIVGEVLADSLGEVLRTNMSRVQAD